MKTETTYIKTLGKVEAKLSRMKEQAAAVRWFYENGNLPESYNRALRLEELSEQTVLLTRVLPAYTGAVGATIRTDPCRGRIYGRGMVLGSHSGTAAEESVRFSGLYPALSLSGYAEVL